MTDKILDVIIWEPGKYGPWANKDGPATALATKDEEFEKKLVPLIEKRAAEISAKYCFWVLNYEREGACGGVSSLTKLIGFLRLFSSMKGMEGFCPKCSDEIYRDFFLITEAIRDMNDMTGQMMTAFMEFNGVSNEEPPKENEEEPSPSRTLH